MHGKILVSLDGSSVAEAILAFIGQVARRLDSELLLLHVVPAATEGESEKSWAFVQHEQEALVTDAKGYVEALVAELAAGGVKSRALVRSGHPAEEIIAAARAETVDFIAMTTHGHSGLRLMFMGSVAEAVLRQAEVPVLLMRVTDGQASAGRSSWNVSG